MRTEASIVCTLLIWKNRHPEYPLIVAANRDEFEERPSSDPLRLNEDPLIVGGRDEVAGGTWLALSERGTIVALTNRRAAGAHDPTKKSRGTLVLELARLDSPPAIEQAVRALDSQSYNPFVLVALDRTGGFAATAGDDGLNLQPISDGLHVVTNWKMDDTNHPKARRATELAHALDIDVPLPQLVERLHMLLSDHAADGSGERDVGLCVHRPAEGFGTVSSSIIALDNAGGAHFYYSRGHACESRIRDASALLRPEDSRRAAVER
ncbi:MAG: NRDE family protein [Candidatus Eremiobacteraeota bacterium]|nr:NRDE family protein [Candidatus Eremiobacteraeota bacterium]MBV8366551.1 NRDE family protein [Candidatus Eremiobacteraeota bacterium]